MLSRGVGLRGFESHPPHQFTGKSVVGLGRVAPGPGSFKALFNRENHALVGGRSGGFLAQREGLTPLAGPATFRVGA